ncbi:hypothetical protein LCGC14_1692250, partial [marine sediment metagenome]
YLYWDYFSSTSIDFSVYNYNTLEFEDKTSSPFTLTTDYFNNVSGTCTIKTRFNGTNPSSSFSLDIDRLRVNYTIPIVPSNTDWLRLTDFRFDIPTEATSIDGIIVEIDRYAQNSNSIRDKSIRLRLISGPVGDDKKTASWWDIIDDDVNNTYGALDNDWNAGLSVSDINNINFGIDISAENIGSSNTAYIDHVRVKIYYTMPDASGEDWIYPNKAKLQDNDYANVTFSQSTEDTSDWLRLANFGFNIPTSGVTINGIEVLFDRQANVSGSIHDFWLNLRNSTGQATGNYANSLTSWDILDDNGYNIYGSPTSLWGVSWSAAEINLNTFGLDLYIEYNGTVATNATLDDVQIKVYYTQAPQDQELWTTPTKASSQNDDYTYVSFTTSTETTSDWLRLTDFGFNVPLGANIDGIKIEIDRSATVASSITDGEIYLRKTSGPIDNDMANSTTWDIVDFYNDYGNSTYLWGVSWTPVEVNSQDFGLDIYINYTGSSPTDAKIDHVRITVYYSYSLEVEISDNKFSIPFPSLPVGDELCSIETILVNYTSYDFSYFADTQKEVIFITLLSATDLDGTYNYTKPISMDFGVSNKIHPKNQFIGSYNFTLLPQDNYTFKGEYYDISGTVSTFTINGSTTIDYFGPDIYAQFITLGHSINSNSSYISFILEDISNVDNYWFNTTVDGYWLVYGSYYTYVFNDSIISEGIKNIKLIANDTQGYESELIFKLIVDNSPPRFSRTTLNNLIVNDILVINTTITDFSDYDFSFVFSHNNSGLIIDTIEFTKTEITQDKWSITLDSSQIPDGYYDIILTATDSAGNVNNTIIEDIYFDNTIPEVTFYEENIYVGNENIYNNTINDKLYLNDQEYILLSSFDQMLDGFNWSQVDQLIATQQGIKNITMHYTNSLAWYDLAISGSLDYNKFVYEIISYNGSSDIQDIKGIQQVKIGSYRVDDFEIILDGTSILLKIDEKYRYLLSPQNSDNISAQLYESLEDNNIVLLYNNIINKWELKSPNL